MITELRVRGMRSIYDSGLLPFGPVTVIVGRNNAGKSALLRSIYLLQEGAPWAPTDVRLGETAISVEIGFDSLPLTAGGGQPIGRGGGLLTMTLSSPDGQPNISFMENPHAQAMNVARFPALEPHNLIYPSFSRQWAIPREEQVRKDATNIVRPDASNVVSRVSTMADPRVGPGREFAALCQRVFGDELTLSIVTTANGQRIASQVDRFTSIGVDAMGTGIGTAMNLLAAITGAKGKIFLIEEPENDLHPAALKALLDVVVERSADNQFIMTTHSNVVLSRLGSLAETKVVEVTSDGAMPPTSTCRAVESRDDRIAVLRALGYELADLDLSEGWLIFEESSAERVCKSYLIPWFAPNLGRLQTIAAAGTSRVSGLVQNFAEMMLFAHLEPTYARRAWTIVDAEPSGTAVIQALRAKYPDWPSDRFLQWEHADFERFYPAHFSKRIAEVLSTARPERRDAKKALLAEVVQWITADERRARAAFELSAASAIQMLQDIERSLSAQVCG